MGRYREKQPISRVATCLYRMRFFSVSSFLALPLVPKGLLLRKLHKTLVALGASIDSLGITLLLLHSVLGWLLIEMYSAVHDDLKHPSGEVITSGCGSLTDWPKVGGYC